MSAVLVRPAQAHDAAGISRVHIATWQAAYAHVFDHDRLAGLWAGEARRTEWWREQITQPQSRQHTLIAQMGDALIGFAAVGPSRDDDADPARVGELYAIYVLPDMWGRGAGWALLRKAVAELRDDGFDEATLWVLEDNPQARAFYERAGWQIDGESKDETALGREIREVRYRTVLRP